MPAHRLNSMRTLTRDRLALRPERSVVHGEDGRERPIRL